MSCRSHVLLIVGTLLSISGFAVVHGSAPTLLRNYYVVGQLLSGWSDPNCRNVSDLAIAPNGKSFLNCTSEGHLFADESNVNALYSWRDNETIRVWLVFSEPVLVRATTWKFLYSPADHSLPDKFSVFTVASDSESGDGYTSTDVTKQFNPGNVSISADSEAFYSIVLNSSSTLEPSMYWFIHMKGKKSAEKVVDLERLAKIELSVKSPEVSPTSSSVLSPSPSSHTTATANLGSSKTPPPTPSVIGGTDSEPVSDSNNNLYIVVGVLGGVIIVLILLVLVIIFVLVIKTKRRTVSIRSGKNTPADEVIYSDPNALSPHSIDITKDPAYSGSTGSHAYDEPHMPGTDYTNCRRMSPIYAEPEKTSPNEVNTIMRFNTLPGITLLSTGSDCALSSQRSRLLTITSQFSGSELKGSTRSLMSVPLGHVSTSPCTGQSNNYHTLDGYDSSNDGSGDDEVIQKESEGMPSWDTEGYAVLEHENSDDEQSPNPPYRTESLTPQVMLISDEMEVDPPTGMACKQSTPDPDIPCTPITNTGPTAAQLEVELMYAQIDKSKKSGRSLEQLPSSIEDHDYAEPSVVCSPSKSVDLPHNHENSASCNA